MKSKAITGMMLTLVLTSILAAISLVSVSHAQPPDGNWMVTSVEVVENKTVVHACIS